MDTTTAATQAKVTTATIRAWCRYGAVAAVKTSGRWIVDAASLARRVALGARRTKAAAKPVVLSVETMTAIGGSRWTKAGRDRVYLNDWTRLAGLDIAYYGTGNIASASLGGNPIANGRVGSLVAAVDKVWFDTADGLLHFKHNGADAFHLRYLSGRREDVDLLARITAGVRAAVAAL